ncbi:MAG: TRAP transporter TatT component family protein [Gemmatimonadetes bacterium]|nr:TRAP transporter TatT component family protein [Gemmatimonadota bacterium]
MKKMLPLPVAILSLALLSASGVGCSINKMVVNRIGNALAAGGDTYASDDDPELIEAATPFILKLMESLLDQAPKHRGLLLATSSGFTQFAYAFVHQDADELEDIDFDAATAGWARAARLYLRARDYGLRGLEVEHKGFVELLRGDVEAAIAMTKLKDVPQLYWTSVSWAAAISLSKDNTDLVADLPIAEALIDRALELDESFESGAIHVFLITYEMSRQGGTGEPAARARHHFERAMALTDGQLAQPLVSLAEVVAVPEQNREEFETLLHRALAIDLDERPEWRMNNLVSQRRARWLLEHTDRLIIDR